MNLNFCVIDTFVINLISTIYSTSLAGISKVFQGKSDECYYDGIKSGNSSDGQDVRSFYYHH